VVSIESKGSDPIEVDSVKLTGADIGTDASLMVQQMASTFEYLNRTDQMTEAILERLAEDKPVAGRDIKSLYGGHSLCTAVFPVFMLCECRPQPSIYALCFFRLTVLFHLTLEWLRLKAVLNAEKYQLMFGFLQRCLDYLEARG